MQNSWINWSEVDELHDRVRRHELLGSISLYKRRSAKYSREKFFLCPVMDPGATSPRVVYILTVSHFDDFVWF